MKQPINLILASGSFARKHMLSNAGINFKAIPADIDEETIMQSMHGQSPDKIAQKLSDEKSCFISNQNKDYYTIGSDQVLFMDNKIYSKAKNQNEAKERLINFQGNEHHLTSAVTLSKNGKILWQHSDMATLTMRQLNEKQIDEYITVAGDIATQCVGCYAIEQIGIRLFKDIKGDYFTILGMPLLPLLGALEKEGVIT